MNTKPGYTDKVRAAIAKFMAATGYLDATECVREIRSSLGSYGEIEGVCADLDRLRELEQAAAHPYEATGVPMPRDDLVEMKAQLAAICARLGAVEMRVATTQAGLESRAAQEIHRAASCDKDELASALRHSQYLEAVVGMVDADLAQTKTERDHALTALDTIANVGANAGYGVADLADVAKTALAEMKVAAGAAASRAGKESNEEALKRAVELLKRAAPYLNHAYASGPYCNDPGCEKCKIKRTVDAFVAEQGGMA